MNPIWQNSGALSVLIELEPGSKRNPLGGNAIGSEQGEVAHPDFMVLYAQAVLLETIRGRTKSTLEQNLLWVGRERIAEEGIAVAFIVHASRGEYIKTTIRLGAVVAVAKGRTLVREGWQVFITGPDGIRYDPSEFERLLSFKPVLPSHP